MVSSSTRQRRAPFSPGPVRSSRPPAPFFLSLPVFALFLPLLLIQNPAAVEGVSYLPVPEAGRPLNALLPQGGIEGRDPSRPTSGLGSEGAGGRGLLTINSQYLKRSHNIDFDNREVEIVQYLKVPGTAASSRRGDDSLALWQAHYDELAAYTLDMNDLAWRKAWVSQFIGKEDAGDAGPGGSLLDIVIPFKVPDWAKRFGADRPRLQINGSYKLVVSGTSRIAQGAQTRNNSWFPSLHMDQQPAFSVKGTVGRLIRIEINSEEGFGTNLKDQLKISYRGEGNELEDDIVQEVEAGNTSLALPGTDLTGYTETHKGIFGLKTRLKFGDLEVTTIASQEGGSQERQKLGSQAEVREIRINDKDLSLHRHFFLSLADRRAYKDDGRYLETVANRPGLLVYRPKTLTAEARKSRGDSLVAYALGSEGDTSGYREVTQWELLQEGRDYTYNQQLRMLTVPAGNRAMSLAFRYQGDPLQERYGFSASNPQRLILIHSPSPVAVLDSLMWRNVYSFGKLSQQDRDLFTLRAFEARTNQSASAQGTFTRLLGLEVSDRPGVLNVDDENIFDFENGLLILPCISNAFPDGDPQNCREPLRRINPDIDLYRRPVDEIAQANPAAYFLTQGRQRKSTFDVRENSSSVSGSQCSDITPDTEKLVLNGSTQLVRGTDYEVLYDLGQITLLSPRARDPNADIEISYECTPLFQISDKILLGTRLDYKLDWISEESLLGATLLYKSQSTTDERPELGREPFNQFLWGMNARLTGSPDWMTVFANVFPFVETQAKSKVRFEFEAAQSSFNPNTKGSAYLEAFENTENTYSFNLNYTSWFQASPPSVEAADTEGESLDFRHFGRFTWHSSLQETYSRIYGRTGSRSLDSREQTLLKFSLIPNDNLRGNSWGGVMRSLGLSLVNQSRKRSLEVVVNGREGNLFVDVGQIAEDISISGFPPDRQLNTEVPFGALTNETDPGLDGIAEKNGERSLLWECKPFCYSREIRGSEGLSLDPAGDDFVKPKLGATEEPPGVNGTQGNNEGNPYAYDTEDLDRSSSLDTDTRFLRYRIALDSTCVKARYCEELSGGWRRYLIPLHEAGTRVDPQGRATTTEILSNTKMIRLFLSDLPAGVSQAELLLARVSLNGNTWEEGERSRAWEIPVERFSSDDLGDSIALELRPSVSDSNALKVSVLNSQENPEYDKQQSPNTREERDTRNDEPMAERSLALRYENLHPGDSVYATRLLGGDTKDLTSYSRLRMEIFPNPVRDPDEGGGPFHRHRVSFGLRFGKDAGNRESQDFYEVRLHMDTSLQSASENGREIWIKNSFEVDLQDLTGLKNDPLYLGLPGRGVSRTVPGPGGLRGPDSLTLRVVGNPSLAQVDWMRLILYVDSSASGLQTGEIWVNDLRLEGVGRSIGSALRSVLQLDFSDLFTLSGNLSYRNGSFTTMSQSRPTPALSKSRVDYNTTLNFSAQKFFPDEYGLQLPLSATYEGYIERPFTQPQSDVALSGNDLGDILKDLMGGDLETGATAEDSLGDQQARLSRRYQSTSFSERYTASYRKEHRSTNLLTQIFLERPELQWTSQAQTSRQVFQENRSRNYNSRVLYSLSPYENPQRKPFSFAERWKYVPRFIKDFGITPYPEKLNLTLSDFSFVKNIDTYKPVNPGDIAAPATTRYLLSLDHGLDLEWRPLTFFGFGYRLAVKRNLDTLHRSFAKDRLFSPDNPDGILGSSRVFSFDNADSAKGDEFLILDLERNRDQTFHMDFNPNLLSFLTTTVGFNSGFRQTRNNAVNSYSVQTDSLGSGGSSSQTTTRPEHFEADTDHEIKFSSSLKIPEFFGSLTGATTKVKPVSKAFESTRKKLDEWRFRNIDANYTISHKYNGERYSYDSLDRYTDLPGFLRYQLGFIYFQERLKEEFIHARPNPQDFDYLMRPRTDTLIPISFSHNVNQSVDLSSGFTIPFIDLSLTGTSKYTRSFTLYRDSARAADTAWVFPDLSLTGTFGDFASRVPFLRTRFRSFTASSTVNYRLETQKNDFSPASEVDRGSLKFAPLLRVAATSNADIRYEASMNLGFDRDTTHQKVKSGTTTAPYKWYGDPDASRTRRQIYPRDPEDKSLGEAFTCGGDFSLAKDVETQKGLQFWRYYIKLQNNLRLKWTFGSTWTDEKRKLSPADPWRSDRRILTFNTKPEASYAFTSNVDALFYYQYKYEKLFHTAKDETVHENELHGEFTMRF